MATPEKWSTAQGRFGRPLRVAGVQHPAPRLTCTVGRNNTGITVTAPFASTLLDGQSALNRRYGDPQTALWFMLYTQVTQTDGASQRNILIDRQPANLLPQPAGSVGPPSLGLNRDPRGYALFYQQNIQGVLALLGLPITAPLSVLAVEILPGPRHFLTDVAGPPSAAGEDPLGPQLGQRRILRTSPLVAIPAIC